MLVTMFVSTCFFILFLLLGNVLLFLDTFAYWMIPLYILLLLITMRSYDATCKVMEKKDFLYTIAFTILAYGLYRMNACTINADMLMYFYVATFLSFLTFSCSIRFKSMQ